MQTLVSATAQLERERVPMVTTKVGTTHRFSANLKQKTLAHVETSAGSHTQGPMQNSAAKARKRTTRERSMKKVRKDHESSALGKVMSGGCIRESRVDICSVFLSVRNSATWSSCPREQQCELGNVSTLADVLSLGGSSDSGRTGCFVRNVLYRVAG